MLNPWAAASLKEGPEKILTVHKSGISGELKRWHDGEMVHRWVAVSLLGAEKRFKKVKG